MYNKGIIKENSKLVSYKMCDKQYKPEKILIQDRRWIIIV